MPIIIDEDIIRQDIGSILTFYRLIKYEFVVGREDCTTWLMINYRICVAIGSFSTC